jgi:hypothetical protein
MAMLEMWEIGVSHLVWDVEDLMASKLQRLEIFVAFKDSCCSRLETMFRQARHQCLQWNYWSSGCTDVHKNPSMHKM